MQIDIVTIFPEYFGPLNVSLIGKAANRGDIDVHVHDLRQWAHDVHRTVDDTPFGGGPGMVMKAEVWAEALDEMAPPDVAEPVPRLVVPTPSGIPFTQARAASYAACPQLVFACGRYEGIDARFIDEARSRMRVDEVSIGDYVLAGGEVAVLVMVEAIGRLLPGVLGNEQSASDDSFGGTSAAGDASLTGGGSAALADALSGGAAPGNVPPGAPSPEGPPFGRGSGPWFGGASSRGTAPGGGAEPAASMAGLLEGPVYTRPRVWRGREVPDVLLSGDHAAIARWRRDAALLRTAANRPDLIWRAGADPGGLSARDWQVLSAMGLSDMVQRGMPPGTGNAGPGPAGTGSRAGGAAGKRARLPVGPGNMAH